MNLQAEDELVLHEGTPIRMKINRTVSSSSAQQGENVDFETLDDIRINNLTIVPKGSTAIGTITEAVPKGHMGKGGKLDMNIDFVRLPNGDKLALRGVQVLKGGGHGAAMTGGIVATAIVFWPAAPFFLFMHGKDISIPEGHEITVYTNSDYKVAPGTRSNIGEQAKEMGPVLRNADVLKLKAAGFSEDVIVAKIKSAPGVYALGTDDLVTLKSAGLSNEVIGAMIAAPSH